MPPRRTARPPKVVDGPECVRAASAGFTVLIVGAVLHVIVASLVPYAGLLWLPLVSVVAYSVAGRRIGTAGRPWLHGMAAALGAWALVLPLRLFATGATYAGQIALDMVIAAVVGSVAGLLAARRRPQ